MKSRPLYLVIGKSCTGKDTFVDAACEVFGMSKVISYTTRASRGPYEDTHHFVDEAWFENHEDKLLADVVYNGNRYGALQSDIAGNDFYIVDPVGAIQVLKRLPKRKCVLVGLFAPINERVERMVARHREGYDLFPYMYNENFIISRLCTDADLFGPDFNAYSSALACEPKLRYEYCYDVGVDRRTICIRYDYYLDVGADRRTIRTSMQRYKTFDDFLKRTSLDIKNQ